MSKGLEALSFEERLGITPENLCKVLACIYTYDRFGKVIILPSPVIQYQVVMARIGQTKFFFKLSELGTKYFVSLEECTDKAKKYLSEVKKYVSISTLKKFRKSKNNKISFYDIKSGLLSYESPDYFYYDKYKLALMCFYEYDDGLCGGVIEAEYPLNEYGKTWALTREELE